MVSKEPMSSLPLPGRHPPSAALRNLGHGSLPQCHRHPVRKILTDKAQNRRRCHPSDNKAIESRLLSLYNPVTIHLDYTGPWYHRLRLFATPSKLSPRSISPHTLAAAGQPLRGIVLGYLVAIDCNVESKSAFILAKYDKMAKFAKEQATSRPRHGAPSNGQ